jgi:hypothetical protein
VQLQLIETINLARSVNCETIYGIERANAEAVNPMTRNDNSVFAWSHSFAPRRALERLPRSIDNLS